MFLQTKGIKWASSLRLSLALYHRRSQRLSGKGPAPTDTLTCLLSFLLCILRMSLNWITCTGASSLLLLSLGPPVNSKLVQAFSTQDRAPSSLLLLLLLLSPQDAFLLRNSLGAADRSPTGGLSLRQGHKGSAAGPRDTNCTQDLHHKHGMLLPLCTLLRLVSGLF